MILQAITAVWLTIGLFSYHGNPADCPNSQHSPFGIELDIGGDRYGILNFKNSSGRSSTAVYFEKETNEGFSFTFDTGVVTGYVDPIAPFVLPFVSYKNGNFQANLSCLPNSDDNVNCALTIKVKL